MAEFSDQILVDILRKAARRVNRRLCLTNTSLAVVIDNFGNMTSPDPDTHQDLYDIVLLQAECLIAGREYQTDLREADGGVLVVDGEQKVDTRGGGVARGTFFDSPHSPCAELEKAIMNEKLRGSSGGPGKLVW